MVQAPIQDDEIRRPEALGACAVLDTPPEEVFNLIARVFPLVFEPPAPPASLLDQRIPGRASGSP